MNLQRNEFVYCGHASALTNIGGKTFLFDPVGKTQNYCFSWFFYPEQICDFDSIVVDYVVVSHEHDDHIDIEILKKLAKKAEILIFDDRENLKSILRENNIPFTPHPTNQIVHLENDIKIYGIFNRERGGIFNYVDSSCIVFDDQCSVYHGNDHFVDIQHLAEVIKACGISEIDYAMFGFSYVNWYPFCLEGLSDDNMSKEAYEKSKINLDFGVEFINTVDAKFYIPNGASLVHYSNWDSLVNTYSASPKDFMDYYSKNYKVKENVVALLSGDSIYDGKIVREKSLKSTYEPSAIQDGINCFNKKRKTHFDSLKIKVYDTNEIEKLINHRAKNASKEYTTDQDLFIESYDGKIKVHIKIKNGEPSAKVVDSFEYSEKYHRLSFIDKESSDLYFSNLYDLEALTGGRRISLERYPDPLKYCKKTWYFLHSL